ncbi:hypothetical protein NUACC21_09680 [Scytonema sp. NUACC21]
MLTCQDVANYFIWLAHQRSEHISNLKLQKLEYSQQFGAGESEAMAIACNRNWVFASKNAE